MRLDRIILGLYLVAELKIKAVKTTYLLQNKLQLTVHSDYSYPVIW